MNEQQNDQTASPHTDRRGLTFWFINNHVLVNILMGFVILSGILVTSFMVKEVFPTIDPKTIVITVPYPGASAEDVADSITRRVEEAIIGVQGIDRVTSVAQEGAGVITAELEDFVDDDEVLTDIETEIDSLQDFPPQDAEEVQVVRTKVTPQVMTLAVYGDVEEMVLTEWAEHLEDRLLALPDVSLTALQGNRNREISIHVREIDLREFGLSLPQVAEQIRRFSVDIPGGTLKTSAAEILVRVQEKKYHGRSFAEIPIVARPDGEVIYLGEIAEVTDGFVDDEYQNTYQGKPAIFIDINRSSKQDNILIQEQVQEYINSIALPEGISLSVWKDETNILKDRINLLARNAILGLALVFLSLVVFLDLRLAFWTCMGIAISFLGGLAVASLFGVTMNMITLFALIVVLGVVVDDAIVTGESIFSEQDEGGLEGQEAALSGLRKVMAPVTVGVLTTVAAFAPLLLSTGMLGQILRTIPIIVISILLMSLVEAFCILPAHLDTNRRWSIGILADIRKKSGELLNRFIQSVYLPFLKQVLLFRWLAMVAFVAVIALPFALMHVGVIKFVFFPNVESDEVTIDLEMPVGTPYSATRATILSISRIGEGLIQKFEEEEGHSLVRNIAVTIGGKLSIPGGAHGQTDSAAASHLAQIQVRLIPGAERDISASQIEKAWQSKTAHLTGMQKLAFESSLVRAGSDVTIQLEHRNTEYLQRASDELRGLMAGIAGVYEIIDTSQLGKQEYVYELTDVGIASGLTAFDLGTQLRGALYGLEIQRFQRGRNEMKVMLRLTEEERRNFGTLDEYRISLPNGERVPLAEVAIPRLQQKVSTIRRVDGRRVVQVMADVDESVHTPDEVIQRTFADLIPQLKTRYPGLSASVEGESRDQRKDLASLFRNCLIALLLIFVLLAGQLRSYAKPFIIVLTIPLGIAGALYGHLLFGYNLSFISLFGIVALTGVVVNDSVVLVDYYNGVRQSLPPLEAILQSCQRRFRPILLTTLTTSLGLLPMLTETSLQARFIIPMAISLGCGVLFASAFLMLFLPVQLMIYEQLTGQIQRSPT